MRGKMVKTKTSFNKRKASVTAKQAPVGMVVLITARDIDEAEKISSHLLEQKLIACANIIPGIQSLFWWQGKIDKAKEVLLVIKTKGNLFAKIVPAVKSVHSYDVPEIIALPIIDGYQTYLRWLNESVQ